MTTLDLERRQLCDLVVERAATMMQNEYKASVGMILDRLLTYAAAQACASDGPDAAAAAFRHVAGQIEAGVFNKVLPPPAKN